MPTKLRITEQLNLSSEITEVSVLFTDGWQHWELHVVIIKIRPIAMIVHWISTRLPRQAFHQNPTATVWQTELLNYSIAATWR